MAKDFHTDNKSFMLYKDWEDIFAALGSEEVGELVMALFAYAKRGEEPRLEGGAKIAFLMMKAAIERDGIAWEEACAKKSERAKKGGRPKSVKKADNADADKNAQEKTCENLNKLEVSQENLAKLAGTDKDKDTDKEKDIDIDTDTDIDTDKDTVTDTDKDTDKEKATDKDTETHTQPALAGKESVVLSYGKFGNVYLSKSEYSELDDKCRSSGLSLEKYISKLSCWLYDKGKTCPDPYKTISDWIGKDKHSKKPSGRTRSSSEHSYDLSGFEEYAMNLDLTKLINKK